MRPEAGAWPRAPLSACVERIVRRSSPEDAAGRPYVGLEHIGRGTGLRTGSANLDSVRSACILAEPGDLVFGALRPGFRKLFVASAPLACTPEAWVLRPRAGVHPGFAFAVLSDPRLVAAVSAAATGTRMPRASWRFSRALLVGAPEPAEQARVGGLVDDLRQRASIARAHSAAVERLARAWWRRHGAVGRPHGPPAGWRDIRVSQLVELAHENCSPADVSADVPLFGLEHLPRRSLALTTWGRAAEASSTKLRVQARDVLFGRLRPGLHKVALAPVDGLASADILALRVRDPRLWPIAAIALSSAPVVAHARAAATGTRMPRCRWEDLAGLPVRVPEGEALRRAVQRLQPLVERIGVNVLLERSLHRLRDAVVLTQLPPPG